MFMFDEATEVESVSSQWHEGIIFESAWFYKDLK
jgi:hypothetical protein